MTEFMQFLTEEDGVVTIEWVALAAGAVLLALGVIKVLDPALENSAESITDAIVSVVDSQVAG